MVYRMVYLESIRMVYRMVYPESIRMVYRMVYPAAHAAWSTPSPWPRRGHGPCYSILSLQMSDEPKNIPIDLNIETLSD